jgi:hypothetical protein
MIWLIYIIAEILIHYWWIEIKKSRPNYFVVFIIRGIAAIIYGAYIDVQNLTEWLPVITMQVCSFWILFDLGLNLLRNKPILYKGKNSGWLDKLPNSIYYTLKIICLIILIIIGIKYFM